MKTDPCDSETPSPIRAESENAMSYQATYCPEDNKIRLYTGRVPRELYEDFRAAGYKSTPKQDCDFVATWGIKAEDMALSIIDEDDDIGDEDQSPEDRAADRAERFAGYREKRRAEAVGHAGTAESMGSAFGFQSAERAERLARRRDRMGGRASCQWSKAEYWQTRTLGVIDNALYKSSASVRRGRLVRLETELRKAEKWGSAYERYRAHLKMRIEYEKQMLESQGGQAAVLDIVPGGHFGKYQIIRVNKSPATGLVVSVSVYAPYPYHRGEGPAPLTLQTLNIQRLGEGAYKPPTAEDLEKLAATVAEMKKKTKARNAGKPKLVNPTPEDAERLQKVLNHKVEQRASEYSQGGVSSEVRYMTQAQYSARSKGSYSHYGTAVLKDTGKTWATRYNVRDIRGGETLCKLRIGPGTGSGYGKADGVICITDKPQKPIPGLDLIVANCEGVTV